MNKITQFIFIFLTPILVACSEPTISKSKNIQDTIVKLKALNQLLYPVNTNLSGTLHFPFNDKYLIQRNKIYADLAQSKSSEIISKKELDYLKIQQRFPERYFPWPAQIDVLNKIFLSGFTEQKQSIIIEATTWVKFVKQRLQEATLSKIKLNKMAHTDLILRIALVSEKLNSLSINEHGELVGLTNALNELRNYLLQYKPRNMLGLRQMPNGVNWYQSKLNYFLAKVKAPDEWLISIQNELKNINTVRIKSMDKILDEGGQKTMTNIGFNMPEPLLTILISEFKNFLTESIVSGLDWQQGYINYNKTFENLYAHNKNIGTDYKYFWLTVAEIDLGIHYQGWSFKQAAHVLKKRIVLNDEEVKSLIEYVVFNPAQIMSGARVLLNTPNSN